MLLLSAMLSAPANASAWNSKAYTCNGPGFGCLNGARQPTFGHPLYTPSTPHCCTAVIPLGFLVNQAGSGHNSSSSHPFGAMMWMTSNTEERLVLLLPTSAARCRGVCCTRSSGCSSLFPLPQAATAKSCYGEFAHANYTIAPHLHMHSRHWLLPAAIKPSMEGPRMIDNITEGGVLFILSQPNRSFLSCCDVLRDRGLAMTVPIYRVKYMLPKLPCNPSQLHPYLRFFGGWGPYVSTCSNFKERVIWVENDPHTTVRCICASKFMTCWCRYSTLWSRHTRCISCTNS
jgi:hypothetical protein